MAEHDPLVRSYRHLADFPRAAEALDTLKRIASAVKPLMRARGWKVPELAEFYPDQHNLLGLNVNRGQKILLRLRHPADRNQFLAREQVTDTMLHELAHIVRGPHDERFHALWNQLRDEHEALLSKGYSGEGFLSGGRRLGGAAVLPLQEARRLARAEAEKRQQRAKLAKGSGQRLGGAAAAPGRGSVLLAPGGRDGMRSAMADAATRRAQTLRGCGNEGREETEIRAIEATATRNGFRTQADEDAANEAAIAQALWELGQEEERQRYGNYYVQPTPDHPEGSGGRAGVPPRPPFPPPPPVQRQQQPQHHPRPRPVSVLVSGPAPPLPTRPTSMVSASRGSPYARRPVPATAATAPPALPPRRGWSCGVCTLYNPAAYLCCDACGTEKGGEGSKHAWTPNEEKRRRGAAGDPIVL